LVTKTILIDDDDAAHCDDAQDDPHDDDAHDNEHDDAHDDPHDDDDEHDVVEINHGSRRRQATATAKTTAHFNGHRIAIVTTITMTTAITTVASCHPDLPTAPQPRR
jgi:hypothetical protein